MRTITRLCAKDKQSMFSDKDWVVGSKDWYFEWKEQNMNPATGEPNTLSVIKCIVIYPCPCFCVV